MSRSAVGVGAAGDLRAAPKPIARTAAASRWAASATFYDSALAETINGLYEPK